MNSDPAELVIAEPTGELASPLLRSPSARTLAARLRARVRIADPQRALAVRDSWRALWSSRLLIWLAALITLATYGEGPARHALNPAGLTRGLGWLGNALAAPAARWDAAWYLVIARYGYRPDLAPYTDSRDAFFPLYPLGVRGLGATGLPLVLAGVLISLAALALALYGIHRLTTLELGGAAQRAGQSLLGARARPVASSPARVARLAVLVTALAPMSFFLSAVYSESLYLALSVGLFYAARRGRFLTAGVLAALGAATRSAGVVLLLPALMLYLYGPREDRRPDFAHARGLWPRYRLRRDVLWLALAPLGLLAYMLYLGLEAAARWRRFTRRTSGAGTSPVPTSASGTACAKRAAACISSCSSPGSTARCRAAACRSPPSTTCCWRSSCWPAQSAVVGVLRALPLAYGAYVIAALALPLSYPVRGQALMSLPRFLVVLFPLGIWLAAWLAEHPRAQRPALVGSCLALAFFTAEFATWHWVA